MDTSDENEEEVNEENIKRTQEDCELRKTGIAKFAKRKMED